MKAPSDALAEIAIAAMRNAITSALAVDDAFGDAHHPGVVKLARALLDDTQRARIECAIVCALEETPDASVPVPVERVEAMITAWADEQPPCHADVLSQAERVAVKVTRLTDEERDSLREYLTDRLPGVTVEVRA